MDPRVSGSRSLVVNSKVERVLQEMFDSIDLKAQLKKLVMSSSYRDSNGTVFDNFESYYKYGDLFILPNKEGPMNKEKLEALVAKMNNEGFDYFFCDYASPNEEWCGDDKKLAELWTAYSDARSALDKHIDKLCEEHDVERDW